MELKVTGGFFFKDAGDDEGGEFNGLLSPFGTVDEGNDVVEPQAYDIDLDRYGSTRPLLWQHQTGSPIGELTVFKSLTGLRCNGRLLMELPEANKAYLLIKARIVKGLSIGFEAIKDTVENGVRHLQEIRLYEGSIVTFPMHPDALISDVKSRAPLTRPEADGKYIRELAAARARITKAKSDALLGRIDSIIASARERRFR
jgi:uncharacterized protein